MTEQEEIENNYYPEEEMQTPNNTMAAQDMPGENSEIGIIKELSPRKVLEQLRMNLKGMFYDHDKNEFVKIEGMKPLMNDKGISKYLSIMSGVVTDLVTFSNYEKEEIKHLALYVCDQAIPTIHINYKDYGIEDKSDLSIINIQLFNLTLAAFKKAVGAGDRNVVRGTFSEQAQIRAGFNQGQAQRRGFFASLNPFGGKQ